MPAQTIRPAPAAQMHAGAYASGEPRIPRNDKRYAPRFAEFRHVCRQGGSIGRLIVPENHAGAKTRQAGNAGQRVRRTLRISKVPERCKIVAAPLLYRPAQLK